MLEDGNKFSDAIKALDGKVLAFNIQVANLKLAKAKLLLDSALEKRRVAEDALDAAERSGKKDMKAENEAVNKSVEEESVAREKLSAANDNVKAVKKGGVGN